MRRIFTLILLTVGLLTSTSMLSRAQTWADTLSRIEKVMSRYQDNNPGAQLAISRNGQIIYSVAKGMANLEDSIHLTTTSRIEAGSVSKQFTAACILLLEQQGKLSTTDDIRKYLPEIPDYGHKITIAHLMHHISGIKDWGSVAGVTGWPRTSKSYTNDDALHIISRQTTLNNIPGDEYIYSNSNYNLQAIIIQRVSGLSLAEFSKKYIFIPAGMTHTEWRDDFRRIVPQRAIAYTRDHDHYFTNMPNEYVYGNGGLLTTAEDLLKWNEYYTQNHLGQPGLLTKQLNAGTLNNGKKHSYAAGLMIDSINGQPAITHSGATAAYRANLEYFPASRLSIAWLSNTSEQMLGSAPYEIRNILVPNQRTTTRITPKPPTGNKPADTVRIDPNTQKEYAGKYYSDEAESAMYIDWKNDKLIMYPRIGSEERLQPVNKDSFDFGDGNITFLRNTDKKITGFYITVSRARNILFKRTP